MLHLPQLRQMSLLLPAFHGQVLGLIESLLVFHCDLQVLLHPLQRSWLFGHYRPSRPESETDQPPAFSDC
uniref:Si:ch211-158m24.12 n=1 Tax=Acanthochromis polyacanthus TaxID=80966 RepID=A0A3Q1F0V3_9TELE